MKRSRIQLPATNPATLIIGAPKLSAYLEHPAAERAATVAVLLLIAASAVFVTAPVSVQAAAVSLTGKYIMAFLACNTSAATCSSPQNHVTHLAESNDSISWVPVPGLTPYSGSVPDAIRRGSAIYLYNPGTYVRFDLNTGTQTRSATVTLKFANGTTALYVDPSVYLDSGGTLHLFYLPGIIGQDPAQCPSGHSPCTKYIMSATEVAGSDGSSFIVDSGIRASYQINQCCFSDPAVFKGPSGYYLYVSEGQSVLAFDSTTLAGSYSPVQGLASAVLVPPGMGGVPSGYYDNATQSFWTYVSQGMNVETIARASTANVNSQIGSSSFSTVISGCTFQGLGCSFTVGSPAIHLNVAGPSSTTSSTTLGSSSTSSSSSSRTTSSSSSAQTVTTSSLPPATTTVSSTSKPVPTTTASSTSTTSAGGIPEFPYQALTVAVLAILVPVSYLLARTQKLRRTGSEA